MIKRTDLLAFNFYKKEKFTGSYLGMRYLIQKASEEEQDVFSVVTWPGPYNFESTPEEQKAVKSFPFEPEALEEIAEYLNGVYEANKDNWPVQIMV